MVDMAEEALLSRGLLKSGDVLGVVAGTRQASGSTNFMRLHTVTAEEADAVTATEDASAPPLARSYNRGVCRRNSIPRDLGAAARHGGSFARDHPRTQRHRLEKRYGRDLLYRGGDSHYVLLRYWNSEQARSTAQEDPELLRCWARLGNEIQILKVYEKLEEVGV